MNRFGDAPLFLVGPRACGKTTLARELAARLGWSSTDTDQWLLERTGASVADLVSAEGWEGFRRREAEALRAVARTRTVVATGGGMVLLPENRAFMRKSGPVLYLEAPPVPDRAGAFGRSGRDPAGTRAVVPTNRAPYRARRSAAFVAC